MALTTQILWDKYKNLKIIDVHRKMRENVNKFIVEHFRDYKLFKVLKVQEETGIEEDLQRILKHILENDCSIVVMDKETNKILAVALLKWMSSEWHSWTALLLIINSERFRELCEMTRAGLEQHSINNNNSSRDSLHLFGYYICKDLLKDECFKKRFFNAIYEVARHMHMTRVTYMCLSEKDREIIKTAGFEEIVRIIYSMYVYKGRRPFDRLRDIYEMYGGLYEKRLEPLIPFDKMVIRHEKLEELTIEKQKKKEDKEKAVTKSESEED